MLSGHQTRWPNDKMLVHPTCWVVQHLSFGRAFRGIVPDLARIGTHILRTGGATAAGNAGVPVRFFLRHGRWS